ncbi:MAG: hypothetical protein L0Z70_13275 [Chloroflexi bacterium]|nr:hypothetical protein [Chloroflexota bacterium]
MAEMGRYCKAYSLREIRNFPSWEMLLTTQGAEAARRLNDDAKVYLQDNLTVTQGVFKDENILFDAVTSEWNEFCLVKLGFAIPANTTRG